MKKCRDAILNHNIILIVDSGIDPSGPKDSRTCAMIPTILSQNIVEVLIDLM